MKKSMLSGWSSIPGGILFLEIMYICTLGFTRYRALLSADADGTLVNRPRKQMPPLVALVFLLD